MFVLYFLILYMKINSPSRKMVTQNFETFWPRFRREIITYVNLRKIVSGSLGLRSQFSDRQKLFKFNLWCDPKIKVENWLWFLNTEKTPNKGLWNKGQGPLFDPKLKNVKLSDFSEVPYSDKNWKKISIETDCISKNLLSKQLNSP